MLILQLFPDFPLPTSISTCICRPLWSSFRCIFNVSLALKMHLCYSAFSAISLLFRAHSRLWVQTWMTGTFMIILHRTSTSNIKVALQVPERANSSHVTWTSAAPVEWEMKIMELFCCSSWLNSCVHPPWLKPAAELKARGQRNTYNKSSNPPVSGAVYCNPPPLFSPLWPLMFSHLPTVNVAWIPGRAGFMQSFNLNLKYHQLVQRRLAAA